MYYVQAGLRDKIRNWLSKLDKVLQKMDKETEDFSKFQIKRTKDDVEGQTQYQVDLVNRETKKQNKMLVILVPQDDGKYTVKFKLDINKKVAPVKNVPEDKLTMVIEETAKFYYGLNTKLS